MLVLTRKANEQILIGDDIKITLVRIRGNSVRVGIEAPREVRVVRGELASRENELEFEFEGELEERETVFAHPQPKLGRHQQGAARNRLPDPAVEQPNAIDEKPRIYAARIRPASIEGKPSRAPLAGFVSAT